MMVSVSTRKPQNVNACAIPGTVHLSNFRCPSTSVASVSASRAGCDRTASRRSGAGWPARPTRASHHNRRPASANASAVRASPTTIRTTTKTSLPAQARDVLHDRLGGTGCQRTPRPARLMIMLADHGVPLWYSPVT